MGAAFPQPAWLDEFYARVTIIDNQGVCALGPLMFTVGLYCGLHEQGHKYRYCYANLAEAIDAIDNWDGTGHPSGPWIVRKGKGGDLRNPDHPDYDPMYD